MKKVTYLILTISLISSSVVAQNTNAAQPELDSGTIEQQFDYIINKSTKYKDFQLIRKASILKVKDHALDSLKVTRTELNSSKKSAINANKSAEQLSGEVKSLNTQIESISKDVDSISFIGMPLSKSGYNSFVWIIIAILLGSLATFILLFRKGHVTTKNAQTDLDKVNAEFESFRKKALLKEQETMRKLQDEINKHSH
jgi:septal ring factor EnvC (AmiA/AmiB activator)